MKKDSAVLSGHSRSSLNTQTGSATDVRDQPCATVLLSMLLTGQPVSTSSLRMETFKFPEELLDQKYGCEVQKFI